MTGAFPRAGGWVTRTGARHDYRNRQYFGEDAFDDVLRSCLEHVERSRKEPGCISHDVHVDCQNPMRLFFFEQWADEAALRTHFAVERSKAFVRSLKGRIVETSGTKIYRAEAIPR